MNGLGVMVRARPPGFFAGAQTSGDELFLSSAALDRLFFEVGRAGGEIHVRAPVAPSHHTALGLASETRHGHSSVNE